MPRPSRQLHERTPETDPPGPNRTVAGESQQFHSYPTDAPAKRVPHEGPPRRAPWTFSDPAAGYRRPLASPDPGSSRTATRADRPRGVASASSATDIGHATGASDAAQDRLRTLGAAHRNIRRVPCMWLRSIDVRSPVEPATHPHRCYCLPAPGLVPARPPCTPCTAVGPEEYQCPLRYPR